MRDNEAEMGVGGGIVYDSKAYSEYREALLKGDFLKSELFGKRIFETILYEKNKGFYLLDLHLDRLKRSCFYFGIDWDRRKIMRALGKAVQREKRHLKVKLSIDIQGKIEVEKRAIFRVKCPVKITLSRIRTDPKNLFLYHKTTHRLLYDRERQNRCHRGIFEVIFLNKKGEVTEGSISNIFILKDNRLYTPPVKSGLLPGVLREHLISAGRCREKTLYLGDLQQAERVYVGNSVRGLMEACFKYTRSRSSTMRQKKL